MRKITPQKIALARKLRAEGLTREQIAEQLGVSCGSVSAAWREAPATAPAPPPPPPASSPPPEQLEEGAEATPLTRADLRATLAEHLRDLQASVRAAPDQATAATFRRMITTLVPALARVTPEDPEESGDVVRVNVAELRAEGDALRRRLHDLVDRAVARANGTAVNIPMTQGEQP